ncbi:hypothetical protein OROMI_023210 [Orobanche minor]
MLLKMNQILVGVCDRVPLDDKVILADSLEFYKKLMMDVDADVGRALRDFDKKIDWLYEVLDRRCDEGDTFVMGDMSMHTNTEGPNEDIPVPHDDVEQFAGSEECLDEHNPDISEMMVGLDEVMVDVDISDEAYEVLVATDIGAVYEKNLLGKRSMEGKTTSRVDEDSPIGLIVGEA